MLERLLDFEQSVWIAAALLYLLDTARLVQPAEVLLAERRRGGLWPLLARVPFEWAGKHLYWAEPALPQRAVLRAPRHERGRDAEAVQAALQQLDAQRAALQPLRWLASLNFMLLFTAAPLVTWRWGLGMALLTVVPVVYLFALAGAGVLLRRASRLGLTPARAWLLAAECLLCVPYSANLVKKATAGLRIEVDGIALAQARMLADEREQLASRLRRIEEDWA